MISTKEVYEDLKKDDGPEQEPATTTTSDDMVDSKVETSSSTEGATASEGKEEVKDATVASPKTDADGEGTKKYTQQEKINFSFSKMKKKHAAEVEALNRKIQEQQKIIDDFNAKSRDSYKSDDEYLDAKLDAREAQRELNRSKQESLQLAERQQGEAMRERVQKLYPTEALQKVYTEAVEIGQKNGALQAIMEDPTIKKYVFESEKSPLLIEAFCRKPAILQKVLDTSDNRKAFAMYDIEQKLAAMVEKASQPQSTSSTQTQATTPAIPVVGKVANNGTGKSAPSDDWASDKELFKYARSR